MSFDDTVMSGMWNFCLSFNTDIMVVHIWSYAIKICSMFTALLNCHCCPIVGNTTESVHCIITGPCLRMHQSTYTSARDCTDSEHLPYCVLHNHTQWHSSLAGALNVQFSLLIWICNNRFRARLFTSATCTVKKPVCPGLWNKWWHVFPASLEFATVNSII